MNWGEVMLVIAAFCGHGQSAKCPVEQLTCIKRATDVYHEADSVMAMARCMSNKNTFAGAPKGPVPPVPVQPPPAQGATPAPAPAPTPAPAPAAAAPATPPAQTQGAGK